MNILRKFSRKLLIAVLAMIAMASLYDVNAMEPAPKKEVCKTEKTLQVPSYFHIYKLFLLMNRDPYCLPKDIIKTIGTMMLFGMPGWNSLRFIRCAYDNLPCDTQKTASEICKLAEFYPSDDLKQLLEALLGIRVAFLYTCRDVNGRTAFDSVCTYANASVVNLMLRMSKMDLLELLKAQRLDNKKTPLHSAIDAMPLGYGEDCDVMPVLKTILEALKDYVCEKPKRCKQVLKLFEIKDRKDRTVLGYAEDYSNQVLIAILQEAIQFFEKESRKQNICVVQ